MKSFANITTCYSRLNNLFIVLTFCLFYSCICCTSEDNPVPTLIDVSKEYSLQEYRQIDTNGVVSETLGHILFGGGLAPYIYTDIDLLVKNRKEILNDYPVFNEFISSNKENLKIYRDPKNNAIYATFLDTIICSNYLENITPIYYTGGMRGFYAIEDADCNLTEYYSGWQENDGVLRPLRESLHKIVERYANNSNYQLDMTKNMIYSQSYPNFIILQYDAVKGMEILIYDNLDKVDFFNQYFIDLADLFYSQCKEY